MGTGNAEGTAANAEAIEAWNTVLFDKFVRFRYLLTEGLGTHGDAALARIAVRAGERVIDIGCGFGDTTRALADRGAIAVGVDAAPRFIEAARQEAREAGRQDLSFAVKDVESDALEGPYDAAFARFGTMFFANPMAAMRNVRASLTDAGRLCMVVWRRREDNDWLYQAEVAVRELIGEVEDSDAPTCGPGPFSMAGADMVSDLLAHAGFERIALERHDGDICIGESLDDGLEFAMALGPAGELLRLAGDEGERKRPAVIAALRSSLARFQREDGSLWAPSSTWIVTANAR
jgi:SAM-dependent methyltransferase